MANLSDLISSLVASISAFVKRAQPEDTGDWADTVGPPNTELPPVKMTDLVNAREGNTIAAPTWSPSDEWEAGWYAPALKTRAHPGRVGGTIVPQAVVLHTTDTMPGGFASIVRSWVGKKGAGNGAHFMIGRDEKDGVVQFVCITKNANHAGGKPCGMFQVPGGKPVHPNTSCIGIELDAGGGLGKKKADGTWRHPDTGRVVAEADVFVDTRGRGWHRVTTYQLDQLQKLLTAIQFVLKPFPAGTRVKPTGDYKQNVVPWADSGGVLYPFNCVGHVTLDPVRKTDPGPQVMGWLK
jgi:N-acetyl-anhydromuramyl-L-alanine amidase AmpD